MDSRWQMYQDRKILQLAREEDRRHRQDEATEMDRQRDADYESKLDIYREERA